MVEFIDSGMVFSFPRCRVYRIENSTFIKKKQDVKPVECLCFHKDVLTFIEAKSSFPKPESNEDFEKNLPDAP